MSEEREIEFVISRVGLALDIKDKYFDKKKISIRFQTEPWCSNQMNDPCILSCKQHETECVLCVCFCVERLVLVQVEWLDPEGSGRGG